MSCGCAGRMRRYILPNMGYSLEDGVWKNPDMDDENLREISDEDISRYYTELTVRLAITYGKKKFYNWWSGITNKVVENVDDHWNELTTRYREYKNERQHTN
jgi:hypothetical protein